MSETCSETRVTVSTASLQKKTVRICYHNTNTSSVLASRCASATCTLPLMLFQSCLAALAACCARLQGSFYCLHSTHLRAKRRKSYSAGASAGISSLDRTSSLPARPALLFTCWSVASFLCHSVTPWSCLLTFSCTPCVVGTCWSALGTTETTLMGVLDFVMKLNTCFLPTVWNSSGINFYRPAAGLSLSNTLLLPLFSRFLQWKKSFFHRLMEIWHF